MDYKDITDIEVVGYIDKERILSLVTEEEIFSLVFGFQPKEYSYVCSPFREDTNPGCWFERSLHNGKLLFMDYADPFFNKQDCFSCVKRYFNLPNFYKTLLFIKDSLIESEKVFNSEVKKVAKVEFIPKERKSVDIYIKPRNFVQSDKLVWYKYGITRTQLVEDKVIPVSKFTLMNTKKGNITSTVHTNCYAYTEFENNKKKLYFPYKTGKGRFITNCNQNDIGNVANIRQEPQLVITKSYKDCRVLRNQGVNCIWFQNEGMIPDEDLLISILSNHTDIVVLFDNDETGITASAKLVDIVNRLLPGTCRSICIPIELLSEGIKDSSDMYLIKSKEDLINFLMINQIKIDNAPKLESNNLSSL